MRCFIKRLVARHVAGEDDYNVDNYPPRYRVPNSASPLFLKSGADAAGRSSRRRSAV
jgi:hypothetical protein